MTEDVLQRAFEPFFTTKNIGEGSGLGLSQVYGFVNQSGGEVKITSTPNVGTEVSLYLPRCDLETPDSAHNVASENSNPAVSETILVVEDEELVRDVAVEMIRELGYKVVAASNGAEALEVLQGVGPVDLLFSDVLMPGGISGVALAIKARQIRQGLKVLLTSGYPATEGARVGAPDFPVIRKPYQRDKLSLMLRAALDLKQAIPA